MRRDKRGLAGALVTSVLAGVALVGAGQQGVGQLPSQFPLSHSIRERGSSVTGAFEGWYRDQDGIVRLLIGYFNRNTKQELDIPIGSNNRIEPGGPDQGQPTHFLPLRQWGVFSIGVPSDFGTRKLTWTLVSNGQTNVITMHLRPEWIVEPFEDASSKNTPPVLKFQPTGQTFTGPPASIAAEFRTTMPNPVVLTTWVTDEGPKVNVPQGRNASGGGAQAPPPLVISWSKYRGPGLVSFEPARPSINQSESGKAATTATFSEPGEYILRVQANDQTGEGGGGFQCCWTNAHVKVIVAPNASPRTGG